MDFVAFKDVKSEMMSKNLTGRSTDFSSQKINDMAL